MRWRVIAYAAVAIAAIVSGWWMVDGDNTDPAIVTGVALSLVVPGLTGMWRRPGDRAAGRTFVAGLTVGLGSFRLLLPSWAATLGAAVWYVTPLAVLWSSLDSAGRQGLQRIRPTTAWVVPSVLAAGFLLTSGPRTLAAGLTDRPMRSASWSFFAEINEAYIRQANPLVLWPADLVVRVLWIAWATWVVGASAVALFGVVRARRRSHTARTEIGGLALAGICAAAVSSVATAALAWPEQLSHITLGSEVWRFGENSAILERWYSDLLRMLPVFAAAVVGAGAVFGELVRPRLSRSRDGALQLSTDSTPDALRLELARALDDPTVRLLYRSGDGWVDEHGMAAEPAGESHRAATIVTRDGVAVAVVEYDVSLLGQPDLVDVAATTAALALDGRRLAALAEASAEDARASAARLLAAADEGRRDIERRIAEGPDRVLAGVATMLSDRPVQLATVRAGLLAALADVRAIAHGGAPLSLTEDGLAAAFEDLHDVSPVPFEVLGVPVSRLPAAVEVTLYLIVADAVARATGRIDGTVGTTDDVVTLRLSGVHGSLDTLVDDRVEALGGDLEASGSTVTVRIPVT